MRSPSPLLALCLIFACTYNDAGDLTEGPVPVAQAAVTSPAMITWDVKPAADSPAPIRLTASDGTGLELVNLDSKTVVQDPLAFTELQLSFKNTEDRVREGRFEINLPDGATISRFAMKIGDRWQEGEVVEKQRARRVYEDFLHRGQDPALLEKAPGNTFTARVFPIPAGGVKDLIISWSQELTDSDDGLSLPLGGLPEVDALSVNVNVDYGDGDPSQVFQHTAKNEVPKGDLKVDFGGATRPVGLRSGEYSVVRVTPDLKVPAAPLKNVTLLFDTSASRAPGFASQVERVRQLVAGLPNGVNLRLLAFDQEVAEIYNGRAAKLDPRVMSRLLDRQALGASDLEGALEYVAKHPAGHDRLVLIGDGVATAGALEDGPLEAAVKSLGAAGYSRVDAIIDGGLRDESRMRALTQGELAQDGVVLDADLGTSEIARRLSLGTADAVRVEVKGAQWVWPRTLEGLQPGDEALVYAVVEAGTPVQVQLNGASVADATRWLDVQRPLLERASVAANLRRLDHERGVSDDAERKAELTSAIVGLSTRYRVLTDDTALLVLESEEDYARYEIAQDALADILTVSAAGGVDLVQRSHVVTAPPEVVAVTKMNDKKSKAKEEDKTEAASFDDADMMMPTVDGGAEPGPAANGQTMSIVRGDSGLIDAEAPALVQRPSLRVQAPIAPPAPEEQTADDIAMVDDVQLEEDVAEVSNVSRPRRERVRRDGDSTGSSASSIGSSGDEKLRHVHPWSGRYDGFRKKLDRGNVVGALAEAKAWRAEDPGDVLALVALGEALKASGDLPGAARAFGSIIDLFPGRADMRRMAGQRLASLGGEAHDLAVDTWTVSTEQRPDHLNGWRLLATGLLAQGEAKRAFEVLEDGLKSDGVRTRPGVVSVLQEDLGLAGAAWIAQSPKQRDSIIKRAQAAQAVPPTGPSTRFVLSWETDANDVDLHVWDRKGNHAYFSNKSLASGGALLADVTNGYGPELFVMDKADAGPYKLAAHYYSRGPMGYGMGTMQIVTHDGRGGITVEDRPFVVMVDDATVDLGTFGDRHASR